MPLAVLVRLPLGVCAALFAAFVPVVGAKKGVARVPTDPPVAETQRTTPATGKMAFLPDLLADINALVVKYGYPVNMDSLVLIVQAQAKAGDMKEANKLLANALLKVNEVPYDSFYRWLRVFAWAQVQTGDIQGAKDSLDQSKARADKIGQSRLKAEAFADIAVGLAEVGNLAAARKTIIQAKQTADGMDSSYLYGKAVVAGEIAVAQAQIGDTAEAKETALTVSDPFQKLYALCHIATAQAQQGGKGSINRAKDTLLSAKKAASEISTTDEYKPYGLALIAQAQAKSDDKVGASETVAEAERANTMPYHGLSYAFPILVSVKAEIGDMTGAERMVALIKEIPNDRTKEEASRALAVAYAEAGQWEKAARYEKRYGNIRRYVFSAKAQAQARSGAIGDAREAVKAIESPMDQIKVLCTIIMEIVTENKASK